jgi:hypothetical protein
MSLKTPLIGKSSVAKRLVQSTVTPGCHCCSTMFFRSGRNIVNLPIQARTK